MYYNNHSKTTILQHFMGKQICIIEKFVKYNYVFIFFNFINCLHIKKKIT